MTSYLGHMTFDSVLKRLFRCDQTVDRILNWPQFNFKKAISMCRFWPILDTLDHTGPFLNHTKRNTTKYTTDDGSKLYKKTGFNRFKPAWTEKTTLLPLTDNLKFDFCKNNLSFQPIIIKSPDSGIKNRIFHDNQVHKNKKSFLLQFKTHYFVKKAI